MCSMARASAYWAEAARPAASSVSPVASEIRWRWKNFLVLFTASGASLVDGCGQYGNSGSAVPSCLYEPRPCPQFVVMWNGFRRHHGLWGEGRNVSPGRREDSGRTTALRV